MLDGIAPRTWRARTAEIASRSRPIKRSWTPANVAPPYGRYSQAVLVPGPGKLLLLSGLLGTDEAGRLGDGVTAQADLIFAAVDAALGEAGMARDSVVRLVTYLVDLADRPAVMAARDAWVADPPPASTLVVVAGLVLPGARVEIEVTAMAD